MNVEFSSSPLWIISKEPALNSLIASLEAVRPQIENGHQKGVTIRFSRSAVVAAREGFNRMIQGGEAYLHALCELLCQQFFESYRLHSVVIGEIATSHERFTITQNLSRDDLYSNTDLDLGNRQVSRLRIFDGRNWSPALLISNVVEYQPLKSNTLGIHKIQSRIKAEEEIWNKVVDEIFHLDEIVARDKELRHLSRYVKDVFGIKIVVTSDNDIGQAFDVLSGLCWTPESLISAPVPATRESLCLQVVEVKDYTGQGHANEKGYTKESNWQALKAVVAWAGCTFEVQIQGLPSYLMEKEVLTRESHEGFKSRRERIRDEVAQRYPLFKFYREVLRWLFGDLESPPPEFSGVRLLVDQ